MQPARSPVGPRSECGGRLFGDDGRNGAWRYGWTTTLGGSFTTFTRIRADSGIDNRAKPLPSIPTFPGFLLVGYNPGPSDASCMARRFRRVR